MKNQTTTQKELDLIEAFMAKKVKPATDKLVISPMVQKVLDYFERPKTIARLKKDSTPNKKEV